MRPDRPVIVATVTGRTVALRAVRGCTTDDVRRLVARAAIPDYRATRGGIVLGLSRLPDVEALAELSGVVIVRSTKQI